MNTCIYDAFNEGVLCLYVCVCLHDNLKTIADIHFLLNSYIDWRKISDEFACQNHRSRSFVREFKVVSCSVVGSETAFLMALSLELFK